jgi:glycolate oxidase
MGDGNLHPTFLTNERNHEEMERVEVAMREIFEYAVSLGGTITGEHGVGVAKKTFLPAAVGELNISIMWQMKRAPCSGGRVKRVEAGASKTMHYQAELGNER